MFVHLDLAQCLSRCNADLEFILLTVKVTGVTVPIEELELTDIRLNIEHDGYLKLEEERKDRRYRINPDKSGIAKEKVVLWKKKGTSSKNDRLLVVIKVKDDNVKCKEFVPVIKVATINREGMILLQEGTRSSLGMDVMNAPERTEKTCYCSFLAMFQRAMVVADSRLSLKRYFCNDPSKQCDEMGWSVFFGRQDVARGVPRFRETPDAVTFEDGRYKKNKASRRNVMSHGLIKRKCLSSRLFINIYMIIHHWARHDARKGPKADELLWQLDRMYSPYDWFYRPSFDNAHESLLRTYDFTVTQCLRNWIFGLFHFPSDEIEDTFDRENVVKSIHNIIDELNTFKLLTRKAPIVTEKREKLHGPIPILAAKDVDVPELTKRAGKIIQSAVLEAFPFLSDSVVSDRGVIDEELFTAQILRLFDSHRNFMRELKSLTVNTNYTITALAGRYLQKEETMFDVITRYRRQLVFPNTVNRGDTILIFDDEGVTVAYFWSLEFTARNIEEKKIRRERIRAEDEQARVREQRLSWDENTDDDVMVDEVSTGEDEERMNPDIRLRQFDCVVPRLMYTFESETPPTDDSMFVWDLFNVYTLSNTPYDGIL